MRACLNINRNNLSISFVHKIHFSRGRRYPEIQFSNALIHVKLRKGILFCNYAIHHIKHIFLIYILNQYSGHNSQKTMVEMVYLKGFVIFLFGKGTQPPMRIWARGESLLRMLVFSSPVMVLFRASRASVNS